MQPTTILARPGIRHSVERQQRELLALKAHLKKTPNERRPCIAKRIADHEAHLAALDAIDDPDYLVACLLAGCDDVRGAK